MYSTSYKSRSAKNLTAMTTKHVFLKKAEDPKMVLASKLKLVTAKASVKKKFVTNHASNPVCPRALPNRVGCIKWTRV